MAAHLFERLKLADPGTRRRCEVRVTYALLDREAATDLLHPSLLSGTLRHSRRPPEQPPALTLKRTGGRRGLYLSGLSSVVTSSLSEVEEVRRAGDSNVHPVHVHHVHPLTCMARVWHVRAGALP